MKLIDRYIIRLYLANIASMLAVIFAFVVTVDVALNLDRFWKRAAEVSAADASVLRLTLATGLLVWDLWWPRLLQLFNFMNGLALVGGMAFTFRHLVRNREMVAVLTSGWSIFRVARPVLIVAGLMFALQALNQEVIVPRLAADVIRDHGAAGARSLESTALPLTRDSAGRLFHAREFTPEGSGHGTLEGVYIVERDADGAAVRRITADSARWREGGWDLVNGVTVTHEGPEGVRRIETDLDPLALRIERYKGFRSNLSWGQIGELLERMPADGGAPEQSKRNRQRLERLRWSRIAGYTANFLTLCISLSFFLRRDPSELAGQALKCAPVTLLALVGGAIGSTASVPGVPPQVSVFIPTMVLLPIAVALVSRVRS